MTLPLEGIRILDSAHQYPGPYCSMLLADLGADVLKIERPGMGDLARQLPHFFQSVNRNKKSLTLDLKQPAAKKILHRLVKDYDVFTEGFRPGVVKRLGIDYETLKKINPQLVYCSISGYGQDGPYRDLPGHDLNYLAMAGMLDCFKDNNGNVVKPGVAIGDLSSGMFAAISILAALTGRQATKEGRCIDVSMFDGLLSWMGTRFGLKQGTGKSEMAYDPGYGIFKGGDGKSLALGIAHEDWFWDRCCQAIGLDELTGLTTPERRDRREALMTALQTVFSTKPADHWVKELIKADVPVSPVHELDEISDDPHVKHRDMFQDITLQSGKQIKQVSFPTKISNMSKEIRMPPPELGEHNDEILEKAGYSKSEIANLKKEGVI